MECTVWLFVPVVVLLIVLFFAFDHHLRKIQIPDVLSKYVLITGCDSGFGERACCRLDAIGCNVIAACLTEDGVARIGRICSGRVHPIAMDVTDESSVQSAVESVSKILPEGRGRQMLQISVYPLFWIAFLWFAWVMMRRVRCELVLSLVYYIVSSVLFCNLLN